MRASTKTMWAAAILFTLLMTTGCSDMLSDEENLAASPSLETETSLETKPVPATSAVIIDNGAKGETVNMDAIVSWRDIPFQTVKHQAYDYSCGSAAVATLVTYTYGMPASEKEVFEEMFSHGDQDKIRQEGFSMLDMSRYLNDHGLQAKGLKITDTAIPEYKVPFIALINNKGYNHFVVVKTLDHDRILVGDPNTGNAEYQLDQFNQMWNGLALIVTNKATRARAAFVDDKEWQYARAHAPVRDGNDAGTQTARLSTFAWQIAPTTADMMPVTLTGIPSTANPGGGL